MSATSFTPNLGLCAWEPQDRPKRIDFVNDNSIIDKKLGEHLVDNSVHVTAAEKLRYDNPYRISGYAGNGEAVRSLPLESECSFAIIFQMYYPPVEIDTNSNTVMHFGIVTRTSGSSANLTLRENSLEVTQDESATDGVKNNFNEKNGQYVMLLFR